MSTTLNRGNARLWTEGYLEDLTAHGLCRITATATYLPGIVRLLWGVMFAAAFAFSIQQCSVLLNQFRKNDVDVSVDFSFNKVVNFPALTICNLNALRRSEVLKTRLHEHVNTTAAPSTVSNPATTPRASKQPATTILTTDSRHLEFYTSHIMAQSTIPATLSNVTVKPTTIPEPGMEVFPTTSGTTVPPEMSLKPQITVAPNFQFTTRVDPGGGVTMTATSPPGTSPSHTSGVPLTIQSVAMTTGGTGAPATTEKSSGGVCIVAGMVVRPFGGFSCTVLQQLLGEGTGGSTNKDSSGTTATKAPVVPGFVPDDFFQPSTPGSGGLTASDVVLEIAGSYEGKNLSLFEHIALQSQEFRFVKIDVTQHEVNYQYDEAPVIKEEISVLGHQIEDMLIHCEYDKQPCFASNFTKIQNGRYGNCYTFNSEPDRILKTERVGPAYGLLMELDIQQSTDYIGQLTQSAGIRMVLHKQGEEPFPEDDGFNLSPAFKTYVGIRQVVIERKGPPYGTCRNEALDAGTNETYTKQRCLRECLTAEMIQRCGCVDPSYINANASLCHAYENQTAGDCLISIDVAFKADQICSDCEDPCRNVIYRKTISQERWPSQKYEPALFARLAGINKTIDDSLITARLRDNYLQVVVYFEEFNFQTVTQRPALELVDLLSYIGGTLGLFVGISVLSLAEFLDIILNLSYFFTRWFYKRVKQRFFSEREPEESNVEVFY